MIFTTEQLEKISELAGLFFTYEEIAIYLNLNIVAFVEAVKIIDSDVYKYYHAGKIESEYKLRKKTMERALKGSPAAEEMMAKHLITQNVKEKL